MRKSESKQKFNSQVDILTVDPESLTDINDVEVNRHLPQEKRIAEFLMQI